MVNSHYPKLNPLATALLVAVLSLAALPAHAARTITLTQPNAFAWYEPDETVPITWTCGGDGWQASDTVELHYSSDGMVTWTRIQGANRLPYNAGSYIWSTSHIPAPAACWIRITFNGDSAIYDISDSHVMVAPDQSPPVIKHDRLCYTSNTTGPYPVRATITDSRAVTADLFWSKNGGAYTQTSMAATGSPNEYSAAIPGPSAVGDQFSYYIRATDNAAAANTATSPKSAPGSVHAFSIGNCGVDLIDEVVIGLSAGTGSSRGNVFACTVQSKLTEIEQYLSISASTELRFFVHESPTVDGYYYRVFEKVIPSSGTGGRYYSSGSISVPLRAGYYYLIGVGSPSAPEFHVIDAKYVPVGFGTTKGLFAVTPYPTPYAIYAYEGGYNYRQRLHSCRAPGTLAVTAPNGGQIYEPGQPVSIAWSTSGPSWQPWDTVMLEYSTDGGSSWSPIPGAGSLAYNAGSFSWDTTGLPASSAYRVRVTFIGDGTVTDSSNANFTISPDDSPPSIVHTPLTDSFSRTGPYQVYATVTDNRGLAGVTLYWSRNGSAYSPAPMAAGTPGTGQYSAGIPGPSAFGDIYSYYIEATDTSLQANTTRSPAGAPGVAHSFAIISCRTDTIGDGSDNIYTSGRSYGNVFYCTKAAVLTNIEQYLGIDSSTELRLLVYESGTSTGSFSKIHETIVPSSQVGTGWYGSGLVQVLLKPGRWYAIGAAWQGYARCYFKNDWRYVSTIFGDARNEFAVYTYPPPDPISVSYADSWQFYQRVTACLATRALQIDQPDGGSRYEQGSNVEVKWGYTGSDWTAGDTVRLDYSTDSGATWTGISGAEALPYTAGSFAWDTTTYPLSDHYRVRVTSNQDAAGTDQSDADFILWVDNDPPAIAHTPLADTPMTAGLYRVMADITDYSGVNSATLHWSLNGGAYSSVEMTPSGSQYTADIPGPSRIGDRFCYYIEARDGSRAGNVTRYPAEDACFSVVSCGVDTFGLPGQAGTAASARAYFNEFSCTAQSELTQIEQMLDIPASTELRFLVYEASYSTGTFTKVHETVVPASGTGFAWYGSGAISVPLVQGKYYLIGVAWEGQVIPYYSPSGHPTYGSFGNSIYGYSVTGYPPASSVYVSSQNSAVYTQRISSCRQPRMLEITSPNGGEPTEPGTSVSIAWKSYGPNWLPADTVRLEVSVDSGATWNGIPGAESLPYNGPSYLWDTAGCLEADTYRVRVVFNADPSVSDASNADFRMHTDTVAPVITHTPVSDSYYYGVTVQATITDDYRGVAYAELWWSKNGGAFSKATMSKSGDLYTGYGSVVATGDVVDYYIVAVDKAIAANQSREPATGYHRFTVMPPPDKFTEDFSSVSNPVDLDNMSVVITPDGSYDYYSACTRYITCLPTDPMGGTPITPPHDGSVSVPLDSGAQVSLYGVGYPTLYVWEDGCITFGTEGYYYPPSVGSHFYVPRVSGLFADLNAQAGQISVKQLADRVAVTYLNVPVQGTTNSNTFQIEMFFDGRIVLSYLRMDALAGVAGVSDGKTDYKRGYTPSDLSAYAPCSPGLLAIQDSIAPATDLAMPLGVLNTGSSRTEHVTLSNPSESVIRIDSIRLADYVEDFGDSAAQQWEPDAQVNWSLQSGRYRASMTNAGSTTTMISTFAGAEFSDFYYEVKARRVGYAQPVEIPFRASADFDVMPVKKGTGYSFYRNDSACGVRKVSNGTSVTLRSAAVPSGAPITAWNTYSIKANGPSMAFYINGTLVMVVNDSTFKSGRIGVGGAASGSYPAQFEFDDILIGPEPTTPPSGRGYQLASVPALPLLMGPGQSCGFDVLFAPQTGGEAKIGLAVFSKGTSNTSALLSLTGAGLTTDSPSRIKLYADGTPVGVRGKVVSAAFDGRFYIQEPDRTSGICVIWGGASPAEGSTVSVLGTMTTVDGERAVQATSVD